MLLLIVSIVKALPCKVEGEILNSDGTDTKDVFVQVENLNTGYIIGRDPSLLFDRRRK